MLETPVKKYSTSFQLSGRKISELGLYKIEILILWRISASLWK